MSASATIDAPPGGERWVKAFTKEELQSLLEIRDLRGWANIALDWGIVFAAMVVVARWPSPLTIVPALFVIGGRQLGFAILMHEAAHRILLSDRRWNDLVGNWLCAFPVWGDLHPYRAYHLQHHAKTGTPEDPDIDLAAPFPVTRRSLARKVWRDLSGQTGWKRAKATLRRDLGRSQGKVKRSAAGARSLRGVLVTNAVLLGLLTLAGHPALYLLWVVSWLTTYSLAMRIRSIAEHGMVPDTSDELRNTRTTHASWWERLVIAPNRVNYHLEHHLLMTVPLYHLPRMHALLRERGLLDGACLAGGYAEVLRLASSRPERRPGDAAPPLPGPAETTLTQRPPF